MKNSVKIADKPENIEVKTEFPIDKLKNNIEELTDAPTDKSISKKKQANFRLSHHTLFQLAELSKRYSVSQADVLTILIHKIWVSGGASEKELDEWFKLAKNL
jgi:hypothetical protein